MLIHTSEIKKNIPVLLKAEINGHASKALNKNNSSHIVAVL